MSNNEEYVFLQEEESRLNHLLAEARKRIKDLHRKMIDVNQELNVALEFVEALKQNLRMLKYGAPIVGLQRYKEARSALKANEEVIVDCKYDLQRAEERLKELHDASKSIESQIRAIQERKEHYGKIVQFPAPDQR